MATYRCLYFWIFVPPLIRSITLFYLRYLKSVFASRISNLNGSDRICQTGRSPFVLHFKNQHRSNLPAAIHCKDRSLAAQKFVAYKEHIKEMIEPFAINHDMYADDTQLQKRMCLAAIQTLRFWSGALQKSKTGAQASPAECR